MKKQRPLASRDRRHDKARICATRVSAPPAVERTALGEKVHEYKKNLPKGYRLSEEELEMLARELPRTPGCAPTKE